MSTIPREPRQESQIAVPPGATTERPHEERELEQTAKVVVGGSSFEAVLGAGAVVLAILGLAQVEPLYMLSIATIALGAALLIEGAAIMARFSKLVREVGGGRTTRAEIGGGTSIGLLAGAAGIVLGVLALIGMLPITLCAIAAIVLGGALLLSSGTTSRLADLEHRGTAHHEMVRYATDAAAGTQALVGLAAIVLGVLALIGMIPLTLTLVALLSIGASLLLSGGAVTGQMATFLRH